MADAALARAARYGDGWTVGNETPERYARERARLQAAWEAAGRDDAPHTLAQPYFALGPDAGQRAERSLRDYYGFAGDYADRIVASAATDADTVRRYVREYAEVGVDELIFFPCDPDPDQVDLLADAIA
jgi:alkanesulfonate monooxygenase SsuD/methylene tetrahydromethanopterin reductase-like flavin-dependent oxidoreductase (luciferase family)